MSTVEQLDKFRSQVNRELAIGALTDVDLPVVGDNDSWPVVVALEDEQLSAVLGRVRAAGGRANLFVQGLSQVSLTAVWLAPAS